MNARLQFLPQICAFALATLLAACVQLPGEASRSAARPIAEAGDTTQHQFKVINRLTWGASA